MIPANDPGEDVERQRELGAVAQPVVEVDPPEALEDDRHPEHREGEEHEGEEGDQVVEPGVLADRRDHADGDADEDRQDQRCPDELERHRDAELEVVRHRQLGAGRDAEVAVKDVAEPEEVAGDDGSVEVEVLPTTASTDGRAFRVLDLDEEAPTGRRRRPSSHRR